jgi:hypothetical protein
MVCHRLPTLLPVSSLCLTLSLLHRLAAMADALQIMVNPDAYFPPSSSPPLLHLSLPSTFVALANDILGMLNNGLLRLPPPLPCS